MKLVKRDGEYAIYRKRNQRFAVRRRDSKAWVRGDDKVAVLLANGLIEAPAPKAAAPTEEAAAEPAAAENAESTEAQGEGGAAES